MNFKGGWKTIPILRSIKLRRYAYLLAVGCTTIPVVILYHPIQLLPKYYSSVMDAKNEEFKPMKSIAKRMENLVHDIQKEMVDALEVIEGENGQKFIFDKWNRSEGGYGCSAVLQEGKVFEKAGVNISIISSSAPKPMLEHMRARKSSHLDLEKDYDMFVAGVSMVIHPINPMCPTFHANYRYFELRLKGSSIDDEPVTSWFGGGCDLTPSYLFEEDAVYFHSTLKKVCDSHDLNYYTKFKKWCDEYFVNTHRSVGGIFFDDLDHKPREELFSFVKDCGHTLVKQYIPIIEKRKDMPYTSMQKEWQQLRRGRYVEFNLIHDRGTKFGLVTPGVRIESVLMSLPLTARWQYDYVPKHNTPEDKLVQVLRNPIDWV